MRAGACICRILFPTGASNNHNESFPCALSFASFCTLHQFRKRGGGGKALTPAAGCRGGAEWDVMQ